MYLRCSSVLDSGATPCHTRAIIGFCGCPHGKAFSRTDGTTLQVANVASVLESKKNAEREKRNYLCRISRILLVSLNTRSLRRRQFFAASVFGKFRSPGRLT